MPESTTQHCPSVAAAKWRNLFLDWRLGAVVGGVASCLIATPASAQTAGIGVLGRQDQPESVYAPPEPPREDSGTNEGAFRLQLSINYLTDNIWRGIERFEFDPDFPRDPSVPPPTGSTKEDYANLQFDGKASFDLGKFPSPFVRLFLNVGEESSGEVSSFQELNPTVGFDWNLRPFIFTIGHTNYIFPEDEADANGVPESAELFGRIEIDDSYFFRSERPIFSPYVFAAYDYSEFEGIYIEAGVSHMFVFEDTPFTLTAEGHVAYVSGLSEVYGGSAGFQHYQVGLIGDFSLNQVLNFSKRYGEWSIRGYLYYTGEIEEDLRASEQLWGGAGIGFKY